MIITSSNRRSSQQLDSTSKPEQISILVAWCSLSSAQSTLIQWIWKKQQS